MPFSASALLPIIMLAIAGFLAVLAASIYISRFYPERLASGLPRIFDYFGTIMPNLREKLEGQGRS